MTTKNQIPAQSDPLAGIPTATAKPAPAAQAAPVGNVINLAQAKKKRVSGPEFKAARDFARRQTGYDSSSPIWGQRMPAVLVDIETTLAGVVDAILTGDYVGATAGVEHALEFNRELQKRIATGQLISAQTK